MTAGPAPARKGNQIADTDFGVANAFPVALDVGVRVHRFLQLGGYFQYAATAVRLCPSETSCAGHDLHGGAAATLHAMPDAALDPWIGVTFGYGARRVFQRSTQWGDVSATFSGPELGVETGLAFPLTTAMRFGPFVGLGLSRFRGSATAAAGSRGGEDGSQSIDRGWSGSVLLGVRLGYGFGG